MDAEVERSREDFEFEQFESRLAAALLAADPGAALKKLRAESANRFEHTTEDGFRMSALIIARLRFERLLNGSPTATRAYRDDAERFTAQFRRYHHAVPPRATHPAAEADAYEIWRPRECAPPELI